MNRPTCRFADWVRETLGACTDEDVRVYFAARGLVRTEEQWRRLRHGRVAQIRLETWCRICEITGRPLSYFFEFVPAGAATPPGLLPPTLARRPRRPSKPRRNPDVWQWRTPPPEPLSYPTQEVT